MTENNITRKIAEYIFRQKISVSQIVEDINVAREKIELPSKGDLTATEFLELCAYLHIKPEEVQ